jgi:hypothetical protein
MYVSSSKKPVIFYSTHTEPLLLNHDVTMGSTLGLLTEIGRDFNVGKP